MGCRLLTVWLLCGLVACASPSRPDWIDTIPQDADHLYGVGSCGPTSGANRGKAQEIAYARAVEYLGKSIRVSVTSSSVLIDTERSTSYLSESIQFSDEDLRGVEIVETWEGEYRAGKPQITYVLVRMPRSQAVAMARRQGG